MIKAPIPDQFLADWFVKSLLPTIAKDVALSGAVTEEQVILLAQHLDLVYSQFGFLYDILLNAPRSWQEFPRSSPGPHADGIVGFVANVFVGQVVSQMGQMSISPTQPVASQNQTPSSSTLPTTDIHSVQNTNTKGDGGKKKNKNKKNKGGENPKQEAPR